MTTSKCLADELARRLRDVTERNVAVDAVPGEGEEEDDVVKFEKDVDNADIAVEGRSSPRLKGTGTPQRGQVGTLTPSSEGGKLLQECCLGLECSEQ
ncbi:2260_t:CDS:2 [Diversispora eburnea]|uniref:2260_t:CDS:1 n=1 Tax=Diversispora eburnea TaxID=1213867 RepID=A0A9N9G763_9GLOM|nr:2260_t:CDS:2 [Diversispora eburnea]